ncbi:protein O-mannosyl-transferase [Candidatus Magnetomoraceae bacterium gMMP-13]
MNKAYYKHKILISLFLTLLILAAYGQIRNFDFAGFDDKLYVTENSHVQSGFTCKSIAWAFTTYCSANWHPVTWLSHILDYEIYGLNPGGHHWTNLLFHTANSILLFFILYQMTGALWQSAFVAALFALHPLHVESVAWISERKDVLSTFFAFLSIGAYYRYVKKPGFINYFLIFLFLSLGLMAKPMLVTLPFILILFDFWPLERFQFEKNDKIFSVFSKNFPLILEKIPLFIPVIISSVLTFIAQHSEGAVKSLESLPFKTRLANAIVSYVQYIIKAVYPNKLAVFYPHPGKSLPAWQIIGAVLLLLLSLFFAIRMLKKYKYAAVGLFLYLGTLVPAIGLVQVGAQAMADRYTYIPLIGIFIIITWGITDLTATWHYKKIILIISSLLIISGMTASTFFQTGHWKNSVELFEHAVKVTDNNCLAHNNLGVALFEKGRLDKTMIHYKEALRIKPDYSEALYNMATLLYNQGNIEESALYYKKALKVNPDYPDAHHYLGNTLVNLGKLDEAGLHYSEALRINPGNAHAHYDFGLYLIKQGKTRKAGLHFAEVIKINPKYFKAYNKIGIILARQGKLKQAKVFFLKALKIKSDYKEAQKNLNLIGE